MIKSFTATNSSHVQKVEYNDEGKSLRVEYQNGRVYTFSNVPAEVYEELVLAPSVGKFLNEFVYNKYDSARVA
jgi:hypothetical protein